VGVGVGEVVCDFVGVGATASAVAVPVTVPAVLAAGAVPVTAAASVKASPVGALAGMAISPCSWITRPLDMLPSVHVVVPSPLPQTVKSGAGVAGEEWLDDAESFTVTLSAAPPFGVTVMLKRASWPELTDDAWADTVTQRSVGVAFGVDDTGTEEAPEPDALGCGAPDPPGSGAAEGSVWHWLLVDATAEACDPARTAAVAPVHTMAAPASTANTEDPARFPRVRAPGREASRGVGSRFSIIG
jgi:hypothetical protein